MAVNPLLIFGPLSFFSIAAPISCKQAESFIRIDMPVIWMYYNLKEAAERPDIFMTEGV